MYEDSCYTLITVHEKNLDRATLTCTDYYNGTLYEFDNTTVNVGLRDKFGDNGNDLEIVDPTEYSRFTLQDGLFSLFTTFEDCSYSRNPDCVRIESDGMKNISGICPGNDSNYICKRGKFQFEKNVYVQYSILQVYPINIPYVQLKQL